MVTSSVSSPEEELNFFNFLLYSHLLPWSQSPSSRDWKYLKHIPGLCQHIAILSQGSFQETCPWGVAMNVKILMCAGILYDFLWLPGRLQCQIWGGIDENSRDWIDLMWIQAKKTPLMSVHKRIFDIDYHSSLKAITGEMLRRPVQYNHIPVTRPTMTTSKKYGTMSQVLPS